MTRVVGVMTTGIYCLEGVCSGRPKPSNTRWFATALEAEASGLRACHQCRPYRQDPFSTWVGTELICQAVRLILDGALHGGTEEELAHSLGVSARHLRRRFLEEVGTTPVQLARSSRAHFARRLLDDTDLSITEIAFAAGFGSVRQFNRTMQQIFRDTPRRLRERRRSRDRLAADGGLALRLPTHQVGRVGDYLAILGEEAIPGVESVQEDRYRRTIEVEGAPGVLELGPGGDGHVVAHLHLPHWENLIHHARRARRVFRLDDHLHPSSTDDDPGCAGGPVASPGAWDPFETGVASILRRTGHRPSEVVAQLVQTLGQPVPGLSRWELSHLFPRPGRLAGADLDGLGGEAEGLVRRWATAMDDADRGRLRSADVRQVCQENGLPAWLAEDVSLRLP